MKRLVLSWLTLAAYSCGAVAAEIDTTETTSLMRFLAAADCAYARLTHLPDRQRDDASYQVRSLQERVLGDHLAAVSAEIELYDLLAFYLESGRDLEMRRAVLLALIESRARHAISATDWPRVRELSAIKRGTLKALMPELPYWRDRLDRLLALSEAASLGNQEGYAALAQVRLMQRALPQNKGEQLGVAYESLRMQVRSGGTFDLIPLFNTAETAFEPSAKDAFKPRPLDVKAPAGVDSNAAVVSPKPAAGANTRSQGGNAIPAELAGYKIGELPGSVLASIGGGARLYRGAAGSWLQMVAAAKKDGVVLEIAYANGSPHPTSAYRTAAQQKAAARSNRNASLKCAAHCWGMAVDVEDNGKSVAWLRKHAGKFGWFWPQWAQRSTRRHGPEPWHWEWKAKSQ